MKLTQFLRGGEKRLGILTEKGMVDATAFSNGRLPLAIEDVIGGGETLWNKLRGLDFRGAQTVPEREITYLPCVEKPEKIICIGLNYSRHAAEMDLEAPKYPTLFNKFNSALSAHKEKIFLPASAEKFDYEAELVIVMGKTARHVSRENALSYVFGYMPGNDLSARDLQFCTKQWMLGKTCDGFGPIGPCITTADEVGDPQSLKIESRVNGELRQSASTHEMIFDCATIISYVSQYITLRPADLIFTGSPSGVIKGMPKEKQHWLKAGDEVRVTIEKLGSLSNIMA